MDQPQRFTRSARRAGTRSKRALQMIGATVILFFRIQASDEHAMRSGKFNAWMHITNDPRFILQQKKRSLGVQNCPLIAAQHGSVSGAAPWRKPSPQIRLREDSMHRDWGIGFGTGGPSPVSYPAKWSFDTTTASCANDFVVYPTGSDGSGTQASIISYFDLYSGCGPTVPAVNWAYDTGGTITGAPSFSFDGSQMAFIQTTAGVASLVLLRLPSAPPGTGTLAYADQFARRSRPPPTPLARRLA